MKKIILIILLQLGIFCKPIMAQMPEQMIEMSVFITLNRIEGGAYTGTGFFYEDSLHMYLITAKHVIFDTLGNLKSQFGNVEFYVKNSHETLPQKMRLDLSFMASSKQIKHNSTDDIVVIEIGDFVKGDSMNQTRFNKYVHLQGDKGYQINAAHYFNVLKFSNIFMGNDVFIFGYPTSLTYGKNSFYDYKRPLLRKGALAGKDINTERLIIDCLVNPGNSGGPVLYMTHKDVSTYTYNLVGIVIQEIQFTQNGVNTGFSVVEPMDKVFKIMYSK